MQDSAEFGRYVIVPLDIRTTAPRGTGNVHGAPRQLFWDYVRVEVHCLGKDMRASMALRRAFIQAMHEVYGAIAKVDKSTFSPTADRTGRGSAVTIEVQLPSPIFAGLIGDDTAATVDDGTGTAIANDVVFGPPIGTPGDGFLTTGDD